jgi:hypothetical protein
MVENATSDDWANRDFVMRDPAVRRAAAKVAVAASKKTGRPVPAWIRELAESP